MLSEIRGAGRYFEWHEANLRWSTVGTRWPQSSLAYFYGQPFEVGKLSFFCVRTAEGRRVAFELGEEIRFLSEREMGEPTWRRGVEAFEQARAQALLRETFPSSSDLTIGLSIAGIGRYPSLLPVVQRLARWHGDALTAAVTPQIGSTT